MSDLAKLILNGDTTALARGITLLESDRAADVQLASDLLQALPPVTKPTFRVGFSGPPGVGKSSFIEKLGMSLIQNNQKVAVLAIDPSSQLTGGSILGDKTRMEELSRQPNAFVRPSPNRGHLGGVTSSMPGVILLCEAAGYDWILIESVGVGQSEIELSKMVDVFTYLSQPGSGDELQGIKKGILEVVDLVVVNKADRDEQLVNLARQHHLSALKIRGRAQVPVFAASALTGLGVTEILQFYRDHLATGVEEKRKDFNLFWFHSLLHSEFQRWVQQSDQGTGLVRALDEQIRQDKTHPVAAVESFFRSIGLK